MGVARSALRPADPRRNPHLVLRGPVSDSRKTRLATRQEANRPPVSHYKESAVMPCFEGTARSRTGQHRHRTLTALFAIDWLLESLIRTTPIDYEIEDFQQAVFVSRESLSSKLEPHGQGFS